jgi:hypothetical protein
MRFHEEAMDLREGSLILLEPGTNLLFGDDGLGCRSTYIRYRVVAIIVDAEPCSFLEPQSHRTYAVLLGGDLYHASSDDLAEVPPVQDGPPTS